MPVVVTGAAGFIGRALIAELDEHGYDVVALDRAPMPDLPGQKVQADLVDGDVADVLRAADAVIHLAGRPGVRDTAPTADAERTRDNLLATVRVLDLVPGDVPLVIASSSSVYGGSRGRPCREDDPLRPLGGYAVSKALAERAAAARRGPTGVARPFTVVGERQRPDMALAVWAAAARRGDPIRVLGSPWRTRDLTDVRDVARALRLMAEREVAGPLNIGSGRPRTLAELVAEVRRAVGVPAPVVLAAAGAEEPADTWADTARLERLLGMRPETDLADVVRRAVGTPVLAGTAAS